MMLADFVVSENDDPFGSDEFNTDVVICTVFVGRARSNQMEFAPFKNQAEQEEIELRTADLQKREPHPPKFVTPLTNQSVQAGSPISIRFLDGVGISPISSPFGASFYQSTSTC
jgi:hypothetical protein